MENCTREWMDTQTHKKLTYSFGLCIYNKLTHNCIFLKYCLYCLYKQKYNKYIRIIQNYATKE